MKRIYVFKEECYKLQGNENISEKQRNSGRVVKIWKHFDL